MSELTKEDLEHIKRTCGGRVTTDPKFDGFYRCVSAAIEELLTLRTLRDAGDDEVERLFPLQTSRQAAPGPRQIPWSIAEIAYGEYSRRYGKGQSLERLAERGGFGWCEMDMYYPDWRKDVSEIESLRQQLREAREEIERLKGDADRYRWLRSHSWHEPYHIFFGPGCNQLEPHHLDQSIDNEMKYPIQGESKPQHEEGDGGYYDLLPGGLYQ